MTDNAPSRSIRRSGHPTLASAALRLRVSDRDLICGEHYGQRPSESAAQTGRTDGSTDQRCRIVQKSLANREPSTDGYKQKSGPCRRDFRFVPDSGHSSAYVRSRADYVGFTPDSRRKWARRWTSAPDPGCVKTWMPRPFAQEMNPGDNTGESLLRRSSASRLNISSRSLKICFHTAWTHSGPKTPRPISQCSLEGRRSLAISRQALI